MAIEKERKYNLTEKQYKKLLKNNIWQNQEKYTNKYFAHGNTIVREKNELYTVKHRISDEKREEFEDLTLNQVKYIGTLENAPNSTLKDDMEELLMDIKYDKFKDIVATNRRLSIIGNIIVTLDVFANNKGKLFELEIELVDPSKEFPELDYVKELELDNRNKLTKLNDMEV